MEYVHSCWEFMEFIWRLFKKPTKEHSTILSCSSCFDGAHFRQLRVFASRYFVIIVSFYITSEIILGYTTRLHCCFCIR